MAPPRLPIGFQSFVNLRQGGFAYADKTPYIARIAASGQAYFQSWPRRFGKSLLVDTLDCAFSGRRGLFDGLYLDTPEAGWDWSRNHPVISISFGGSACGSEKTLLEVIGARLDEASRRLKVPVPAYESPGLRLGGKGGGPG